MNYCMSHWVSQSVSQWVRYCKSVSGSMSEWASEAVSQSVSYSPSHWVSQSVRQLWIEWVSLLLRPSSCLQDDHAHSALTSCDQGFWLPLWLCVCPDCRRQETREEKPLTQSEAGASTFWRSCLLTRPCCLMLTLSVLLSPAGAVRGSLELQWRRQSTAGSLSQRMKNKHRHHQSTSSSLI